MRAGRSASATSSERWDDSGGAEGRVCRSRAWMGLAPPSAARGWLRANDSARPGAPDASSDVKEPDVLRVADDERPPRLDVLTHEHREQLVGRGGVVEGDQPQDPVGG